MKWMLLVFLAISFKCSCQTPILETLQDSIGFYYYSRSYQKALHLSQELLRETELEYGDTAIMQRSRCLAKIASIYGNLGEYDSSVAIYQEALSDLNDHGIVNGMINMKMLDGLFVCHFKYGAYKKANGLLPEVIAIVEERLSRGQKVGYATPLNLGTYCRETGDYRRAKRFLNMGLDLVMSDSSGRAEQDYPICEAQVALFYQKLGDYNTAASHLEHALNYSIELKGKEHPDVAALRYNVGFIYAVSGRHNAALSHFRRAKNMVSDNPNVEVFTKYNYIIAEATEQMRLGSYDSAFATFVNITSNIEKDLGRQHSVYISAMVNLGAAYSLIGSHQKAILIFNKALRLTEQGLGKGHPVYGHLLNNLALQHQRLGHFHKALDLFESIKMNLIKDSISTALEEYLMVILNMADIYVRLNQFEKALGIYYEGEQILMSDTLMNQATRSAIQNGIGLVNYKQGRYEDALPRYLKAIELMQEVLPSMSDYHTTNLLNMTTLHLTMGETDKANESAWRMFNTVQTRFENQLFHLSANDKEAFLKRYKHGIDIMYSLSPEQCANRVFSATVPYKSLVLSQSTILQEQFRTHEDSLFQEGFTHWMGLKSRMNSELSKPVHNRSAQLDSLIAEAELLESALSRASKEFAELQASFRFEMGDLQKALGENAAYIDICAYRYWNKGWTHNTQYRAYIVLPGDTNVKVLDLGKQSDFQEELVNPNALYSYKKRGFKIFNSKSMKGKLVSGFDSLLQYVGTVDTLYISPAGLFNSLNIAALNTDDGLRLWDGWHVELKASTRPLLNKRHQLHKIVDLCLFGGLNYNDSFPAPTDSSDCFNLYAENIHNISNKERQGQEIHQKWAYLNGTQQEVNQIAQLASPTFETTVMKDANGTEAAFKALNGNSPSILHLATHGFFFQNPSTQKFDSLNQTNELGTPFRLSEDPMMRSGLVLSGANRAWQHGCNPYAPEDGILTAREISHLDLSQTQLVVLSACQTGLGDIDNSEGVYGLQRAFKMAGVNYIIMSLWNVPDQETSELMIAFYRNWLEKEMPLSEAFYAAQKKMAADYPKKPELWAGFVLMQ